MVPAPDVVLAMEAMAERISIVSAERVRDELSKLLLADDPRPGLDLLVGTGLAAQVLPELPALQLERDEHHRHKDVYEHSLTVLDQAIALEERLPVRPDLVNRLAALLHDIGKPKTRRFEAGRQGLVPPPRRRRRQAGAQAADRAALPDRRRQGGLPTSSRCTCGSTATARASGRTAAGPTPPSAATSATPATSSSGCTC